MTPKRDKAFTLIELLIVVAIIAILAAIAVPNFLEAQTRSKVSRMKTDLRTIATGLESYAVDNAKYPLMTWPPYNPPAGSWTPPEQFKFYPGYPAAGRAGGLTTPIAYLTTTAAMVDVFRLGHKFTTPLSFQIYYLPTAAYRPPYTLNPNEATYAAQANRYALWVIRSAGPDTWYQNMPGVAGDYDAGGWNLASYDATNGTVSAGDIYRSQKSSDESHI
jgi:prepilin-type N-terminal cleavage/methylation domain-containing protein